MDSAIEQEPVRRPPEPAMELRQVPFAHADVLTLVDEVQAEYVRRYGGPDGSPLNASVFDPPNGAFFVGYLEGRPVAMGGWRLRDDVAAFGHRRVAEIKRMYVAPSTRRRGLARQVLRHLEDTARAAGAPAMVLETGIAQPEAIALYTSSGYTRIRGFGYYKDSPKSRCFGKPL